ncbi:MAG: hypothetical protein HOE90_08175 [Bacteriovoracaceae bacterium]|jgi:hypothetical protein|nr:hypothetical protein [Bacteriovoracaceae bacterium]
MISTVLKFSISFFISFMILSYPIGEKKIFSHLSEKTQGYTDPIFEKINERLSSVISGTKDYGKKLFSNANPQNIDSIKYEISSLKKSGNTPSKNRRNGRKSAKNPPQESYTKEEKEILKKMLKESKY